VVPVDERATRGTVLFVDDERRVLTSMRAMFRRDYEVLLANSGQEALDLLRDHDVDVIVSDQRMPGMTGVEVLKRVKRVSPRSMRILLTGYADLKAIEASINEGEVFRYLTKPCPTEALKEAIALAVIAARDALAADATDLSAVPADDAEPEVLEGLPSELPLPDAMMRSSGSDDYELIEIVPAGVKATPPRVAAKRDLRPAMARPEVRAAPAVESPPQPAVPEHAISAAAPLPQEPAGVGQLPAVPVPKPRLAAPAHALRPVPRRQSRNELKDVDLLALTADSHLGAVIETALGGSHRLHRAANLEAALACLETNPVGVLVTDMAVRQDEIAELTGALKRHVPELVTIVASDRSDAQQLIDLINYGQIFRFLLKPLHAGQCRLAIEAAVGRHREIARDPALARRHAVAAPPTRSPAGGVVKDVLDRVRRLRERIFAAGGVA
jgi:DNA-binding NtrC family response regulator